MNNLFIFVRSYSVFTFCSASQISMEVRTQEVDVGIAMYDWSA
jgi:hypothetical protein